MWCSLTYVAHPLEDRPFVVVAAVLAGALALRAAGPLALGPGVLGDGVEAGPGEVEFSFFFSLSANLFFIIACVKYRDNF